MQLSFQETGVILVREVPIQGLAPWTVFEIVQSSGFHQWAVGTLQGKPFSLTKPEELAAFCACLKEPRTLVQLWCRYARHSLPAPFAQHPLIPLSRLSELWPTAPPIDGTCEFSVEQVADEVKVVRFCSWTALSLLECAVDRWTVTQGPGEQLEFQVDRLLCGERRPGSSR